MTTRLRRLRALAVLPVEVPLLRLQQPCPPCRHRRGALRARLRGRDRRDRRARARPHGLDHLLRRRHAVADAAGDRRRDPRRDRRSTGRSRPMSRSRSKPIRPASRRRASAAIARPASTASRSACRRSTTRRSRSSAACTRAQEALDAVAVARAIFERYSFDLIYARPRPDAAGLGAPSSSAPSRKPAEHLSLYQLTIEPDTPFSALHARRQARRCPTTTPRARSTTRRRRSARTPGLPAYEISNHARPGAECRHNLVYWRGARICRHRPRRAWPPRHRRRAPRHRDRKAAGGLADARRVARPRPRRRRGADARGAAPTNSC